MKLFSIKKTSFCLLLPFVVTLGLVNFCNAQIKNYTTKSGIIKASDECIKIIVDTGISTRSGLSPISFPGLIGSIVSLGVDATKIILSAQEEKYTASYSGAFSGEKLVIVPAPYSGNRGFLNIDSVHIIRNMVFEDLTEGLASEIVLVPIVQASSGMFRFKVHRINLNAAKAKIKKGRSGQLLDLSINIKLEAIYQDAITVQKEDTSGNMKKNSIAITKGNNEFTIKTATLGESTIILTALRPEGPVILQAEYLSNWFQPPPASAFKFANTNNKGGICNYTISVTVKEANPCGISAKKLSEFLTGTTPDINNLIKQILPPVTK